MSSIIKVIGVGGGGSNAVNFMHKSGIEGVDYIVCNTDAQALHDSAIPNKLQLGPELTKGLGAGSDPAIGAEAMIESKQALKTMLGDQARMVFVTACLGGGTGTGAAPVVGQLAREMDLLSVGIVTMPFEFEGKRKTKQAEEGLELIRDQVDCLIVIKNDYVRQCHGGLPFREAFDKANEILAIAARTISEIITIKGLINIDFADVRVVMKDSGVAIMGEGIGSGDNRAEMACSQALDSPLLFSQSIRGAKHVLLNITSGSKEVTLDEIQLISDQIQDETGEICDMIFGTSLSDDLGEELKVTLIATGFNSPSKIGQPIEEVSTVSLESQSHADAISSDVLEPTMQEKSVANTVGQTMLTLDDVIESDVEPVGLTNQIAEPSDLSSNTKDPQFKAVDRVERLRHVSVKWREPSQSDRMYNEPSYLRRDTSINNEAHQGIGDASSFTIGPGDGEGNQYEIRKDNAYLNNNID
ncbi:MAG: cell division protein FtsZ [Bacteroidota bacterium]|nr:cell division protein FtsZ [Bacteroidota bacterium]